MYAPRPLTLRDITKAIKLKGLTLQAKAVQAIERTIKDEPNQSESLDTILESIKQHLDVNPSLSKIIDEDTVSSVIADCTKMDEDVEAERFQLLNAMETPKLVFHSFKKLFSLENVSKGSSLHSGPQAKVAMLRERFLLVQQRIQRHELFCRPLVASANRAYVEVCIQYIF
jgi:DNA polymerase epsilon subunit 2